MSVLDKQPIVNQHGTNGSHRSQDGGCFWTNEIGAAELHNDGAGTHEECDADVLDHFRAVSHRQNDERRDEEHQRELQDDECGHLTQFLGRRHTTGSHLIGQSRGRQTHSSKTHCHRVGHQTDDSREHRFEAQANQNSSRDGHSRTKASHALQHATQAPSQQEHQQPLVRRHLDELRLDGLNLLRLTKDVVTEDGKNDDQNNRETGLEQSLNDRPQGDAINGHLSIFLWHNAHRRHGEQSQNDCHSKSNHSTLITRHLKTHHQDDEQQDRDN